MSKHFQVVHVELRTMNALVERYHRHHGKRQGHRFSIGAVKDDRLVGVCSVGRPASRSLNGLGWVEITRLVTWGERHACSFLYGAAARAAKALGYKKIITYILDTESGTSLRAAGWQMDHLTSGDSWDRPSRKRTTKAPTCPKKRWCKTLNEEPPMPEFSVPNAIRAAYNDGTIPSGYKLMIISASQLDTFEGAQESCQRKWWWSRGLPKSERLPEPMGRSRAFGTVLHEVVARYLSATETGEDPDHPGEPMDLYPEGWETPAKDYKGDATGESLTVGEQRLCKALVTKAIEAGHLVREEGREIEAPFWRHLGNFPAPDICVECGQCKEWHGNGDHKFCKSPGRSVFVMGYIDLLNVSSGQVLDHKTTGNMRWAKSAKKISNATPMLLYAADLLFKRDLEAAPLKTVELVHIAYCKDVNNTRVRRTAVNVPIEKVEAFYKKVGAQARKMVDCASRESADHWKDIPGAMGEEGSRACRAYGGCQFMSICGGRETVSMYRNRLAAQTRIREKKEKEPMAMSMLEAMRLRSKKNSAPPAKPLSAPKKKTGGSPFTRGPKAAPPKKKAGGMFGKKTKTAPKPSKALALRVDDDGDPIVMPWSQDECVACAVEGVATGISSKGSPCRVCVSKSGKDGGPVPDDFDLSVDEQGRMVCEGYTTAEVEVTAPEATEVDDEPDPDDFAKRAAWLKAHKAWAKRNPEGEAEYEWPRPTPKAKPIPLTVKAKPIPLTVKAPPPTCNKLLQSCTVLIGATPLQTPPWRIVSGSVMFAEVAQALAEHEGKESYWQLDPFRRRDQVASVAVKKLYGYGEQVCVVFSRPGPEEHSFIEALKASVGTVIVGTV